MSLRAVQLTYSVGAYGDLRITVYTDESEDAPYYTQHLDDLAQECIRQELADYGKITQYD